MREKRLRKVLVWVVLLALVMGQGNMAFAARSKPVPTSTLDITTGDLNFTVPEDKVFSFSVDATMKDGYTVVWSHESLDSELLQLIEVVKTEKSTRKSTTYFENAKFEFTPIDDDQPRTVNFTIIASEDEVNTSNKDQISVTFNVTPVTAEINTPPVAVDDYVEGVSGEVMVLDPSLNDYDQDGDFISLVSAEIAEGSVAIDFNLEGNHIVISPSEPGEFTLRYVISDGETTSEGIIFIIVTESDASVVYLALGDSIPFGRYYTNFWNYLGGGTDTTSYIEQFAMEFNVSNSDFDQSISGLNTIDIYNQLTPDRAGYNPSVENQVRKSDIITLCIGANDIMDAVPRSLYGLDKYNVNWSIADSGRQNFEIYWQKVIDRIYVLNNDVTLVVMTVYNPYHENESIYNRVDEYFSSDVEGDYGLNYIIKNTMTLYGADYSNQFKYHVADVYDEFNKVSNKDSLTGFYSSFSDPHPNQLGQNLIYNTHLRLFTNFSQ